ncbi:MAG: amino acid adenylation domain-containing protein [Ktedonobacteraceae bacterium]
MDEIKSKHDEVLLDDEDALLALMLAEHGFDLSPVRMIHPRTTREYPPLSFAQEGLWFLDQLQPGLTVYNILTTFRLCGPLNLPALEQSVHEIIRRHEALRTTFARRDEQPVQIITSELPVLVHVSDLQHLAPPERAAETTRLLREQARWPFDLSKGEGGSLLRMALVRLATEEYLFSLVVHHSVSDGWSMDIFNRELTVLYNAYVAGQSSPLPEVDLHAADVAIWQRQWLQGAVLDEQLDYWREHLSGAPALLNLPTDRPRPAMQSFRGAMTPAWTMPQSLAQALRDLSQHEGTTLFMTLLAAFQVLLLRSSGQDDLVVGTPIANRSRIEMEGVMGYLLNTLALRSQLGGNPRFCDVLRQVREVALGAYAHQDVPFEKVVEALQPERTLSHSPLFQVMFVLQNAAESLHLTDLSITMLEAEGEIAKCDLTLYVLEKGHSLDVKVEYSTDLFDADTLERLLGHYQQVLASIVAEPTQRIATLPILSTAQRQQILVEWNQTEVAYPENLCIHALFEEQAKRTPEALAVVYEELQITYQELDQRANQLAQHLHHLGVGPEVLVGLCLERSIEMVVGLFAILKAGGAYVPLDPSYPPERLAFMLHDAQVAVLVTQQHLRQKLFGPGTHVVCLDSAWEAISQQSTKKLPINVGGENLAYVIYTSGSTGQPKGVMNTHGGVRNRLQWMQVAYALGVDDRVLQKTPFSFDVSVWEFFWPLLVGAQLVVARPEGHRDSTYLVTLIREQAITTLHFVPSMLAVFLEEPMIEQCTSIQRVISSGEALSVEIQNRLFARLSAPLYNLYGPTEAAIDVTAWVCQRECTETRMPIGRPIANTQIYLLDKHGIPVPVGVFGELYIGGVGVARGYRGRAALTAEWFVPNPFSRQPGARLYRTGDLARYRPDGALEYLGRLDHQVKLRGFRIELGEIEAALTTYPSVRESIVIVREDRPAEQRLVAYVVLQDAQTDQEAATSNDKRTPISTRLRHFLQAKLPEYMLPSAFVFLESLPLTSNGKVNRRALPAPMESDVAREQSYAAPRTPVEEQIAVIWRNVLHLEQVGVHDDFFALGGHSLLATQVISRLRETFAVDVPLRLLFETPSISALAEYLVQAGHNTPQEVTEGTLPIPVLSRGESTADQFLGMFDQLSVTDGQAFQEQLLALQLKQNGNACHFFPLSFAQQRLWLLDQLEPGNTSYNVPMALRFHGCLDVAAFEHSFNTVVQRHESLRTTFVVVQGLPIQVVAAVAHLALPVIDLSGHHEGEREAEVRLLLDKEAQHSFDLAKGPLLRVNLYRLSEREHVVVVNTHHIIFDGWSINVLLRDLAAIYASTLAHQPSSLPALPFQYADYAVWQRKWLQGAVLGRQLAYWRQQLAGAPTFLDLPTDRPRPAIQTYRGAIEHCELPPTLSERLRLLSQQEGVTLYMTLLALFQLLLYRSTGQADLVVGTPIANRNRADIEGLIGLFVNTLVLRIDLAGNPSFRTLVSRVREMALGAYAHQDLPFDTLVENLSPERNVSHTLLFQVFFNMINLPDQPTEWSGLTVDIVAPHEIGSKFDLTLYATDGTEGIQLDLLYNTDLFDQARAGEMLRQFVHLAAQVLDVEEPIAHFTLDTATAQAILPDPTAPFSEQWVGSVHSLFAQQARYTPYRLAVVDTTESITYQELDALSNRLAQYLRASGITQGDRVAIYGHRSAALVYAVLGILKAGAVFIILDPAYPAQRLIDYLSMGNIRGWLPIKAAGTVPSELEAFLAASSYCCQLELPSTSIELSYTLTSCSPIDPGVIVGPDELACVAFTSGSTGKPKGILQRHGSLSHFLPWQQQYFDLRETDRYSMLAGLAHDPLQREIFTSLCLGGGTLYIPDPDAMGNPGWLAQWMDRQDITVAHLTPAMLQLLTQSVPGATASDVTIPSLRRAFTIGDVLTQRDVARLYTLAPLVTCVNSYGSTETQRALAYFVVPHTASSTSPHDSAPRRSKEIIPLGQGLYDVQLLVLTSAQKLAGIGELGDIYIRSPYLAQGYLDDEPLTRKTFISNPLTGKSSDRLCRTGDLGRYRLDGNVEYAGRSDQQVKLRGFRIELSEIESVLGHHPAVKEAVVIVREDTPTNKRLVAYIVAVQAQSFVAMNTELYTFLAAQLPAYMIPSVFVALETLPLTPNRKVDRRALPVPEERELQREHGYETPRTPVEEVLVQIWSQVLRVKQVGIRDNFFVLGGHSLLATQVISRVCQTFQMNIPLRVLFEAPTVAGLAETLLTSEIVPGRIAALAKHRQNIERLSPTQIIHPRNMLEHPPLSFAQERAWFLDQLQPGLAVYTIPVAFRLRGPMNLPALEQSVHEIVHRHEALRTTFAMHDGHLVQIIVPELQVALRVSDLRHLAPAERETEATRLLEEEAKQPFDLSKGEGGSLLRTALVRVNAEEYVFCLVVHHSISDAWSLSIFYDELTALYHAFVAGQPSPLPEVDLHAADVAVWQRQWLQGAVLEEQLNYWREHLRGTPALLNLPTDRPRPAMQSFRGAMTSTWTLPPSLTKALRDLSQHEGTTLFMILLAAFQVLLLHSSGQEDFVVGTPIANRNRIELEGVMGYLLNTLALRCQLGGNPRFCDVLKQVREVALGAYAHQDVPFEKVVEALQPERALSHSPLFQVMFVLQNPVEGLHLTNLSITQVETWNKVAKCDLTLVVGGKENNLEIVVEYNTDLFDADTLERLLGHYQQVLASIVAEPTQRIATLPILTPAQREHILVEWNQTVVIYPENLCIHALFEEQAKRTPEAVAVVFEEQQITYQELDQRANQLAQHLHHLGVGPEVLVGLCLERSIEMVVGLFAILKAGGAYVPLDPSYPPERLAFMLHDAQVAVLVTQQHLHQKLFEQKTHVVYLDSAWEVISQQPVEKLPIHVCGENLAYVIYTSGSTGQPKGVQITHQAVGNFLSSMLQCPGLSEQDTLLAVTSLSFDIAGLELFLPLIASARLVVAGRDMARDGQHLGEYLMRCGATCMQATPATWRLLLEAAWPGQANLKMLCGGEALPPDLAAQLRAKGGSLWNMYGPTETTIWSAIEPLEVVVGPVLLGRPIANTQIYLLNAYFEPVPIGVPGDLYIGGNGLSRGYLQRPALTAERFVPNPFSRQPGARLYRTGDLARYRSDGALEYLGRLDHQVKLRGFRIELGEIEAALVTHPSVRESVVIVREDIPAEQRLVAYVVPQDEQADQEAATSNDKLTPISTQLRHFLQTKLPDYMLPSAFVVLEALPLTPNGKLDRQALPAPEEGASQPENTYEAPRTPVEEVLAQIWAQVLHKEQVGIRDNFFALGGHSLLATQVISRLRQTFQMDIPLHALFEAPTVAGLVETLLASEKVPGRITALAKHRKNIEGMSADERQALLQKTKKTKG